jgi:hypothetical protein
MIELTARQINYPLRAVSRLKQQLSRAGTFEIIILMFWSLWQC